MEGYCADCAQKKGINPVEVISDQHDIMAKEIPDIGNMTKQLETMFKDLAENINLEDIENIEGAITFENPEITDENGDPKITGAAIPIGSFFSNMFGPKSNAEQEEASNSRKKSKS